MNEEFHHIGFEEWYFPGKEELPGKEDLQMSRPSVEEPVRRILWWSGIYGSEPAFFAVGAGDALISLAKKCNATCEFTTNRTLLDSSHGVVFHGWGNDLPSTTQDTCKCPTRRYKDQVYIYMTLEAPVRIRADMTAYKDFFNWTLTYRLDSDFRIPYGAFVRKTPEEIQSYKEERDLKALANRSNLVAWMASNCEDTESGRNRLVQELQKYIPVSTYGGCRAKKCNSTINPDCWAELSISHKFYLSFENSLCKDYVTEKFFNALSNYMVPVVYGGAHYNHQFAAGSFINVDSFASAKALADYLIYLDGNDMEYLKYFEWRTYYRMDSYWTLEEAYCGACERLHKEYSLTTSIIDINEWLFGKDPNNPVCLQPRDVF